MKGSLLWLLTHRVKAEIEDLSVDLSFDFNTLDGWAQSAADLIQLDVKAGTVMNQFHRSLNSFRGRRAQRTYSRT